MRLRISALLLAAALAGCDDAHETDAGNDLLEGSDVEAAADAGSPENSSIDFENDEPARRIAAQLLEDIDFDRKHSPYSHKQKLVAMESTSMTFCNNSWDDRTITVYTSATLFPDDSGDGLKENVERKYCVSDSGAIRLIGRKAVSLPDNDPREITWGTVRGTVKEAAPTAAAAPATSSTESSNSTDGPTANNSRQGRCHLVVDGAEMFKGPCRIGLDPDGSFTIYENREPGYFAMVMREGTMAEGYWNGDRSSTHAQAELGMLRRDGACWTNDRARVCAWSS
jgi:hypothetical protein